MTKRLIMAGAVVVFVTATALLFRLAAGPGATGEREPGSGPSLASGSVQPGSSAPESGSGLGDAAEDASRGLPGELPGSLQGTDVPGGFLVGADGHLLPTPDAIALFDYYLAASGEEPLAILRARIVAAIHERVDGVAADEAIALLDTYLGLREELRALAEGGVPPHDIERRLQWVRELRRAHFGAETADALFGREEHALAVDLERRRVALDDSLDEVERAERLAELEAELPPEVRAARSRARAPAQSLQEVEALRATGASEEEVFSARAERFGPEAAERLAALDAKQAEWTARLDAFRDELALLDVDAVAEAERDQTVTDLLEAHFDENEIRRVRALEAL